MFDTDRDIEKVSNVKSVNDALCLWVIHADKIPPHIGISFEGQFYSLKANGKDEGVKNDSLVSILNNKKIKTLIYVLNNLEQLDLAKVYEKYSSTIPGSVTCLHPIKEILNIPGADKIHDMIDVLSSKGSIRKCLGLNLGENFSGIKEYDLAAIHERLLKLKEDD